ncbi:hypothetical protein B0H14DRAFT_2719686 [Mycena olivaceomarginata]|nr:hypothetical protein B0H14DRAFT_2719686 [Mycena olivaceomarginata]
MTVRATIRHDTHDLWFLHHSLIHTVPPPHNNHNIYSIASSASRPSVSSSVLHGSAAYSRVLSVRLRCIIYLPSVPISSPLLSLLVSHYISPSLLLSHNLDALNPSPLCPSHTLATHALIHSLPVLVSCSVQSPSVYLHNNNNVHTSTHTYNTHRLDSRFSTRLRLL